MSVDNEPLMSDHQVLDPQGLLKLIGVASVAITILICGCIQNNLSMDKTDQPVGSQQYSNPFLYSPPINTPYSRKQDSALYLKGHKDAWNDGILGISSDTIEKEIADGLIHSKSSTPKKGKAAAYYHGWDDGKYALVQRLNELLKTTTSPVNELKNAQAQIKQQHP